MKAIAFSRKKKVLHRCIDTHFVEYFQRLKRSPEPNHIILMAEFETKQTENQGVDFILVKEMFKHAQKQ